MIETFLQRLEALIKKEGHSIRTFEIKCNISNGTISRALRNNKQFQIEVLLKIASQFPHWDFNYLIHGEDKESMSNLEGPSSNGHLKLLDQIIQLAEAAKKSAN